MSQLNIKKTSNFAIPATDSLAYSFDSFGNPVYIKEDGSVVKLSDLIIKNGDVAIPNIIANNIFNDSSELPLPAIEGEIYITLNNNIINLGNQYGVYDQSYLLYKQFITNKNEDPYLLYQFDGVSLQAVGGTGGDFLPLTGGELTGSLTATTYYGDGSHLTGVQTTTEHNELTGLDGGVTDGTNGEYYHLTSAEYDEVKGNALNLKAMQFVGICKRCNFQPTDIVIDSVNNTISIPTVNGIAISESNPLRYFTDGDGIVHEHVQTTVATASFSNTSGVLYVHFDSDSNFIATQVSWADFDLIATVYRFYLNATLSNSEKIVSRSFEGHLNVMSAEVHAWLHSQGTVHLNGFELVHNVLPITALGVRTISPNVDGRNTVISFTSGRNSDDGLEYTVTHSTNPTLPFSQNLGEQSAIALNSTNSGLFKIRTNDTNGLLNFLPATRFPFAFNATTNVPQYITSTGVRTDVTDNQWFVYYAYALQDDKPTEAVKMVSAEIQFSTYALAQSHDWINLQALYGTLRDKEIRPLYKLIFYCNSAQGGAYNIAVKYSGLVSYVDIRTYKTQNVNASSSSSSVLASNVIVTPSNGFVSIDQQSFDNEIATKFNTHTATTNAHAVSFSNLTSTAHTHTIADTTNLQTSLNNKTDLSLFNAHTGQTNPHLTKFSDLIVTAHTHTIADTTNLQTSLNNKTDLTLFNSHTGQTNPHLTKFSDLIVTAHTHTIADTSNLQTTLNSKLNLTGGTLSGNLTGTTIAATTLSASTYIGVDTSEVTNNSNLSGNTVTDVFNSADAVEVMSLASGDMIALARMNGVVSENKMIDAVNAKPFFQTDLSPFYSHSADTSIHYTKDSINLSDLGNTAHTHTIADTTNLQTTLNSKLSLTGGTMTGTLIGTTISATTYQGIKASHVVNDSTNVTGANLKTVLDNAILAIDGVTIQDGDLFPIARDVEAPAGVFTSVNMYHPWDRIKSELVDKHVYQYNVTTWAEVQNVLADPACRESVVFNLMQDMRVNTLSIYAKNIYFRGAKLIMVDNATLFIEPFISDTYNIYFDCLIETGFDNTTSLIRVGSSSTTSTINVKFKQFKGASTTIVPTIQFGKEGASNTVTASYNELVNVQVINTSIVATREDTFYSLQDEKWAYSHYRTGGGPDLVGKTIAKVTGISDAYGNFSIKVRYRLCYNETDLVLPLFPATLQHGKWVRFETCDYCRDKDRGAGGIFVTPRGFEVAKFYKGDSDLVITNVYLSNEAGAGGIYENQYDDNNTYFYALVRSTLAQSTFKVKYTDSTTTDDNDTWIIVHLRGVIL